MNRTQESFTPRERLTVMEDYLRLKVFERDWHGVADAAADIRELEAQYPELRTTPCRS